MTKAGRELAGKVRGMGLVDIAFEHRRKHLVLTAREPTTNKTVMVTLPRGTHHASNPRSQVQVMTNLRRQLR